MVVAASVFSRLPALRFLWLAENPVAAHAMYRPLLLRMCLHLEKLDTAEVTVGEREDALASTNPELLALEAAARELATGGGSVGGSGGGGGGAGIGALAAVGGLPGGGGSRGLPVRVRHELASSVPGSVVSGGAGALPGAGASRGGIARYNEGLPAVHSEEGNNVLTAVLALLKELDEKALDRVAGAVAQARDLRLRLRGPA